MNDIDRKQVEIIDFFYVNELSVNKISKAEKDDLAVFVFNLLQNNPSNELMSKMVTILFRICFREDITLEEVWEIYWNLKSILFNHSEVQIINGSIRKLYTYIFETICGAIPNRYSYKSVNMRNMDTIVVITSQLLNLGHAPTTRVFDYAYVLQHKLHKKVIIINDSAMNFISNENLGACLRFNYMKEYKDIDYISYKGEKFRLIQSPYEMPNIAAMVDIINAIYEINPILVYNIGADSLVADYCGHFTTTACLPCSNELPISCSKYLLVGRKIGIDDASTIEELLDYQEAIETMINYEYRESGIEYTRQQFGIGEDEFLISIVGNRLDTEVTDDFIGLMNEILNIAENCSIVMIGEISNKDRILRSIKNKDRMYMIGSLNEASKFIKCCDLYLNPKRSGGGRSSFEALHFGVPVITLEYGDVHHTCGEEFSVKNYEEIIQLVYRYYTNVEFKSTQKERAWEKAYQLSDIKRTLVKALEDIIKREEIE